MTNLNLKFGLKLVLAITATVSTTPLPAQPVNSLILVQSSTSYSSNQLNKPSLFNAPPPPDDINAPGHRVGGGKRGCLDMNNQISGAKERPLTALVPVYGSHSGLVLGLTTASHPTFWFYVPYSPRSSAEFVLQDEENQTVYQSSVLLSKTPGVVHLSLPTNAHNLEVGKRYHWYFDIYCQPQQPPFFVDGWIKRDSINSVLQSQLEKATLKQRVTLFANHGFWYDALTAAAELSRTDPNRTGWVSLLQAVGLADISSEPMIECCRF